MDWYSLVYWSFHSCPPPGNSSETFETKCCGNDAVTIMIVSAKFPGTRITDKKGKKSIYSSREDIRSEWHRGSSTIHCCLIHWLSTMSILVASSLGGTGRHLFANCEYTRSWENFFQMCLQVYWHILITWLLLF